MNDSFVSDLPHNYFGDIYFKIKEKLEKGENVLLASLIGGGSNVFYNFLKFNLLKEKIFEKIIYFDFEVQSFEDLKKQLGKITSSSRALVVIKFTEDTKEKKEKIEKLYKIKKLRNDSVCIFLITDHSGVTAPLDFTGLSDAVFSARFYLQPFNVETLKELLFFTSKFYRWEVVDEDTFDIYKLTGGIPRLTKHILKNINENEVTISSKEYFLRDPSIVFELDYLVKLLARLDKNTLKYLGLLNEKGEIASELLKIYFKDYEITVLKSFNSNLSDLESKLLTYLYQNLDQVVSIERLGDLMELSGHEFSPWAIYKLISRLKKKLKGNLKIETYKGRGYMLKTL